MPFDLQKTFLRSARSSTTMGVSSTQCKKISQHRPVITGAGGDSMYKFLYGYDMVFEGDVPEIPKRVHSHES